MSTKQHMTTVSLVLGSGGARGLAHIGVIKWLEHNGYKIESVAGSSMGALIGGMYAAGQLDIYANWVMALEKKDVIRLLDISFARKSLFKGNRIIEVLREMIGDYEIQDLPISYTAVATDMESQEEVWLNRGSLFDAIRASIAIPTIFSPHHYMNKTFLDGSLVNPIPIAPTLQDKTDITIAVSLSGKVQPPTVLKPHIEDEININGRNINGYHKIITQFINGLQKNNPSSAKKEITLYEIIAKSMDTMQSKIARLQLAAYSPNVIVAIPSNACSFYEFYRARELIEIGYQKAEEQLSEFTSPPSSSPNRNSTEHELISEI